MNWVFRTHSVCRRSISFVVAILRGIEGRKCLSISCGSLEDQKTIDFPEFSITVLIAQTSKH